MREGFWRLVQAPSFFDSLSSTFSKTLPVLSTFSNVLAHYQDIIKRLFINSSHCLFKNLCNIWNQVSFFILILIIYALYFIEQCRWSNFVYLITFSKNLLAFFKLSSVYFYDIIFCFYLHYYLYYCISTLYSFYLHLFWISSFNLGDWCLPH